MLAADKLQLQSQLKQQAVRLKEKEFTLHHENLMTVGTQAAVLAGLDITMLIEFQPTPLSDWHENHQLVARCLHVLYYTLITSAFGCNIRVVAQTTALSVLGAGLALRGPDGSMGTATDCLYEERRRVFTTFAAGLGLTLSALMVAVWLVLQWEAAAVCWLVAVYTLRAIVYNYHRIQYKLDFDERETVDFGDLMNSGPVLAPEYRTKKKWQPTNLLWGRNNSNSNNNNGSSKKSSERRNGYNHVNRTNSRTGSENGGGSYHNNNNNNETGDYSSDSYSSTAGAEDVEMASHCLLRDENDRQHRDRHHRGQSNGRRRSSHGQHNHQQQHHNSQSPRIQTV